MKSQTSRAWKWTAIFGIAGAVLFASAPVPSLLAQTPPLNEAPPPPATDAAAAIIPVTAPKLSPRLEELAKLLQSGVSEDVILAFIKNSPAAFNASADEVLYLSDLGLSDTVITTLLQHKPAEGGATVPMPAAAPIVTSNVIPSPSQPVLVDTAPPPAAPAAATYFYEPLRPYGNWVEVEDVGYCWQPTVVTINHSWRPYGDRGHWVYSDCGWYWQSDYSWGWAPFHYGRWHQSARFGWVWMPDSTWGPAWVSWRYHDDYCGWAPLPPRARFDVGVGFIFGGSRVGLSFDFGLRPDHYLFVPTSRFHDRSPYRFAVPATQARTVYNNSTVINNYIVGNNTIVNEGVGRDRIARATGKPIHAVALRDVAPTAASVGPKREVLDKQNNSLLVYRPPQLATVAQGPNRVEMGKLNGSPAPRAVAAPNASSVSAPTRFNNTDTTADRVQSSSRVPRRQPVLNESERTGSRVIPNERSTRPAPAAREIPSAPSERTAPKTDKEAQPRNTERSQRNEALSQRAELGGQVIGRDRARVAQNEFPNAVAERRENPVRSQPEVSRRVEVPQETRTPQTFNRQFENVAPRAQPAAPAMQNSPVFRSEPTYVPQRMSPVPSASMPTRQSVPVYQQAAPQVRSVPTQAAQPSARETPPAGRSDSGRNKSGRLDQ